MLRKESFRRVPRLLCWALGSMALSGLAQDVIAQSTASLRACPSIADGGRPSPELFGSVRLVTGAPYSAVGRAESITRLVDGNRIVSRNQIRFWRDSDGRTRTDFEITAIGGPMPLEMNTTVTIIDDPVKRSRYLLSAADKTVMRMQIEPCRGTITQPEPPVIPAMAMVLGRSGFRGAMPFEPGAASIGSRPPSPPKSAVAPGSGPAFGPPMGPGIPRELSGTSLAPPVSLGERQIDGRTVVGSRLEATIAAGAVGNELPIKMTADQWFSKDLQIVVDATYNDPRTGETRFRLTDIVRSDQDPALFRVPADYKLRDMPFPPGMKQGFPGAR
jgi:hypothetical protein